MCPGLCWGNTPTRCLLFYSPPRLVLPTLLDPLTLGVLTTQQSPPLPLHSLSKQHLFYLLHFQICCSSKIGFYFPSFSLAFSKLQKLFYYVAIALSLFPTCTPHFLATIEHHKIHICWKGNCPGCRKHADIPSWIMAFCIKKTLSRGGKAVPSLGPLCPQTSLPINGMPAPCSPRALLRGLRHNIIQF